MPPWRSEDEDNAYRIALSDSSNTTWSFTRDSGPELSTRSFEISDDALHEAANAASSINFDSGELSAQVKTKSGQLNDRDNIKMELNSLESWFVEQAIEQFGGPSTGELYAEGGFPRVRQRVLEDKSEDIDAEVDSVGDEIAAFNRVTMEWPHEARAYMAAHEHRFVDQENETYDDKLRQFAEPVGVLSYETMQTELDWYHNENPYHDDRLSDDEAKVVMLLRANDDDESIIADVENPDNYYGWYKKTGDAQAALRACQFDSSIPGDLAPSLAPPGEWENANPDNINHDDCIHCGTTFYHVCHHSEGESWMATGGRTDEVNKVGLTREFNTDSGPGDIICGRCVDEWTDEAQTVTVLHEDTVYKYADQRGIRRDWGENDDSMFTPVSDAPSPLQSKIMDAPSGVPDGFFHLEATDHAAASRNAQTRVMEDATENIEEYFDEGPVMVSESPRFDGTSYHLLLPQREPMVARAGKELLDNADEHVETPI